MTRSGTPWELVEKLSEDHDLSDFECGSEEVDTWLHEKSRNSAHLVATYVCLDGDGRVVAFFALRNVIVEVGDLSAALRAGATPEGRAIAILLCFMGIRKSCRGGQGTALLFEAYRVAAENHLRVPVNLFVVDALNDKLVEWYVKNGNLRSIPESRRLALPMKTVSKIVAKIDGVASPPGHSEG